MSNELNPDCEFCDDEGDCALHVRPRCNHPNRDFDYDNGIVICDACDGYYWGLSEAEMDAR